jgi:hypothetical protein
MTEEKEEYIFSCTKCTTELNATLSKKEFFDRFYFEGSLFCPICGSVMFREKS